MGSKLTKYLLMTMAIFYMAFGFFMAFTDVLKDRLPNYRLLIGGILMGYGVFRLVKIIHDIKRLNRQNKGFFEPEDY